MKKVEMNKQQIGCLNAMAKTDWDRAQIMLDGINMIATVKYEWINKRVVVFGSDCKFHDAWACAKNF